MAIMLCPLFVLLSFIIVYTNITRFLFKGRERSTKLWIGLSLMVPILLCVGIFSWCARKQKRPRGFLRSMAAASTRPFPGPLPWDLWRLLCPLTMPSYLFSPKTSFLLRVMEEGVLVGTL